jgi:hypothetical protein
MYGVRALDVSAQLGFEAKVGKLTKARKSIALGTENFDIL